ncbi:Spermidine/putrescine import ATP-binding protein PotA [Clostridiales bacterium CHKCI006]|uniref:ABC transporter ATP-binding protein n=1 Tax=Candidatus Fimiplasma intestinipullorum TaxID=2840825 RepID=A0A9D1HLV0_9FIRM|nr:Spermidine/putrescine import ATP-binding protein PotA [Clostridiales bacterium CHKCI006]HIU13055.1 ABC transporter ATP-binding protein [Candidatus Fimiplasma intestinipullorum]
MAFFNLQDINVSYDKKNNILEGLNLEIEKGELVSLLGPSGCGKTTTLRVVAGFIEPTHGQFILDDTDMTKVPVHKRNFGLVFQSYALFPHLSVFDNVAFGLKLQKVSKEEIKKRVENILEVCDLKGFEKRFPKQLSGGQRQRVALARALVVEPKLLLLDEPLSNLDAKLRINMRVEIKRLQRKLGITTIFVTHDQEECFSISDKVAVMNGGVIEQYDTPENIYRTPKTEFVARFIGFENFIDLKRKDAHTYIASDGSEFVVDNGCDKEDPKGTIRPEDIQIVSSQDNVENKITGKVIVRTFLGKSYQYELDTPLGVIVVNGSSDHVLQAQDTVCVSLPKGKIVLV